VPDDTDPALEAACVALRAALDDGDELTVAALAGSFATTFVHGKKVVDLTAAMRAAIAASERAKWRPIEEYAWDFSFVLITDGKVCEVARSSGPENGWWARDGLDFEYGQWDQELIAWSPLPKLPTD
jgi:hypothetical protein